MATTDIRNITVGSGIPKICVPVTEKSYEDITSAMKRIYDRMSQSIDLIEFRADFFEDVLDTDKVMALLKDIRVSIGEIPLLFTFRTKAEGGEKQISIYEYEKLLVAAAESGMADALDVEIMRDDILFKNVLKAAGANGVKVIGSYHDFDKTPEKEEIISMLTKMEKSGADIAKVAVMPESGRDVLKLLEASFEAGESLGIPIITISMGKTGAVSRIAGEIFGSAVTFGVAESLSAPGQIDAVKLKELLKLFH